MKKANPVLLEPIMAVEIVTPDDYAGDIIGNINSRRGRVENMEDKNKSKIIKTIANFYFLIYITIIIFNIWYI